MADLFPSPSPPRETSDSASPGAAGTAAERKAHREQPRIRRRNRLITSCLECRRRKLKCDKQQPCTNCTKFSRDCLFIAPALDSASQAKLAEVKEKMGILERTLEDDVARRSSRASASTSGLFTSPPIPGQDGNYSDEEDEEDFKGLEPNRMGTEDCAYYEDEGNDDIVDLGIQMGKVRITERIGGFVRPRFSEELRQALKEIPETPEGKNPFSEQLPDSWMAPGRDYVAPSSSFFFAPGIQKTSLMAYLPSKILVDKLMDHYWTAVHVIARTVHQPSFERQYIRFWAEISSGLEPRNSFQAVLFAALLSSVISMSEEKILTEYGVAKDGLVENFKQGTEAALARANFLSTTKLETLQAFVMYLIPLCRAEVSRAHSALTGMCIRLAECMSLHRDPTHYTSDPVDIHIRRLIWYQICFLDLRTCEATGPRPQIRREEYDTKFPLNINDIDLENGTGMIEDRKHFTDMTITRMRFECSEMHRVLWVERPKLDDKRTTLTSVLSKIQKFCQAMEERYLPILNKTQPLHVLAMELYGVLSSKMYVSVLQKFISNQHRTMPERLRQITLSTATMIIEHAMTIEQTPALSNWSWYVGAFTQYHTSLLLLSELYIAKCDEAVEARVWRSLDFVFGLPPNLSGGEKCRIVLEELVNRRETYEAVRRIRAPTKMEHPGPRVRSVESQRREEERTERERSGSVQSATSSSLTAHSGSPPSQLHRQPSQQNQMASLGQVAQYDFNQGWAVDNSAPSSDVHGFHLNNSSEPNVGIAAPSIHPQGSTSTSSGAGPNFAMGPTGAGASPMDSLPEIDWNEWDQLFGTSDTSNSMMIPPFTFPQFSPTDLQFLQWPAAVEGSQ